MYRHYCIYLLVALVYPLLVNANIEYDGVVLIKLEHGLDGTAEPKFTERGNISIPSLRLETSMVHQKISDDDRVKIRSLAVANKYYQLRATVINGNDEQVFLTLVKACMLVEAELNDIITVTLDYTGKVITVTQSIASTSTCQGSSTALSKLKEFMTSVYIRHTHSGPMPDTASYIQKIEREREAREKGDVKDNKSFLSKYWMYIIPVVLIMALSSAVNPDAAGGGQR